MQLTTLRFQVAVLVLLVLAVLAVVALVPHGSAFAPPPSPRPSTAALRPVDRVVNAAGHERPVGHALAILRAWDRQRASAYRHGDVRALRQLYAPASRAGARDVRVLRRYSARGLVVAHLGLQRRSAQLLHARPGLLRLRVLEGLRAGTAVTGDRRAGRSSGTTRLPTSGLQVRTVTLLRRDGRWLVRSVRPG